MTTTSKKLVPNIRFPEFEKSGEWVEKKLEDISSFISSNYSVSSALEYGKYSIYDANKFIGYINNYLCDKDYISIIKDGSGVGRTRYMKAYSNFIGTMNGIVPNDDISPYFLFSLINKINFQQYVKGATIPHIYYSDYSKHIVYITTKEEQKKIADFMSSVDELIKLEQKKLEELQEYKQGLLQNLFPKKNQKVPDLRFQEFKNGDDWKENTISELFDIQMCRRIYKNETSEIGDIPFYKIGTIGRNADAFITKELYDEYRNKYNYPRLKETLITCSGTIGKCIQYNGEKAYFQDSNIVWLRPYFDIINLDYLYIYISNMNWGNLAKTTITRLYTSILKETIIVFPSLKEQQKIADFLLSVDKLIVEQTTKLNLLYDYKKGLLQQLFPN